MALFWKQLFRTAGVLAILGALLCPLVLAAPEGTIIWGYQEGLAKAQSPDGKFGFANLKREIVIPMQYTSVLDFSLGLSQVQLGSRLGVIRQDGTYLIQPEYGTLYHMDAGLYIAQKGTKWGVLSLVPFPDGNGGSTQVFYDFIYDSAEFTKVGGMDTLVLTKDGQKTVVPFYQISQLMLERQVPSARFPLNRGVLPDFDDVSPRDWFDVWVDLAYNLGLMSGTGSNRFSPHGTMTVAEALQLAAGMESRQNGDNFHTQPNHDRVWYQPAVDYCIASGIIRSGEFSSYTAQPQRPGQGEGLGPRCEGGGLRRGRHLRPLCQGHPGRDRRLLYLPAQGHHHPGRDRRYRLPAGPGGAAPHPLFILKTDRTG